MGCRDRKGEFVPVPQCTGRTRRKRTKKCRRGYRKIKGKCRKIKKRR